MGKKRGPRALVSTEDILRHVHPEPNSGCWLWAEALGSGGYARTRYSTETKKTKPAHRVLYERLRGPVPDGMVMDHLCRVRSCVNPYHLEPVPHLENVRRGLAGEFARKKTHCPKGHEYTAENIVKNHSPEGYRACLICRRGWDRARKARKVAMMRSMSEVAE